MKSILITGATGFIGSHVLNEFENKHKIYVTTRKKKTFKNLNVCQVYFKDYIDLNNKLKKIKVNTVIHCATHYIKEHEYGDIEKFINSNIRFGNIILENLTKMNVKKFINFSTVWENHNAKKDNVLNLYSAYKKSFRVILNYYEKKFSKIDFYNLVIADTFGKNDNRKKLLNVLKKNYASNKYTRINPKNLYLNLLNVLDIVSAIKIILYKKIKPETYLLNNQKSFRVTKIIKGLNKNSKRKIRIKWGPEKKMYFRLYKYKKIKNWKPKNSSLQEIINLIRL